METLEKLFGSSTRVKVLRLFLLSPEKIITGKEISKIIKAPQKSVSKEIRFLQNINFIKSGKRIDKTYTMRNDKIRIIKNRVFGFQLSSTFPLLFALRNLLISASPVSRDNMAKFFKSRGKIKLVVLGGIFVESLESTIDDGDFSKLDILVVGDLKKGEAERFIGKLESEIGKELNWTIFTQFEFEHRLSMHDRILRDLLDNPHEFLINKLRLE